MVVEPKSWRGGIDVHGGTWVQTTEAGEVIEHADPLQVTAHKSSALACLLRGFGCGTRKACPSCESPAPARGGNENDIAEDSCSTTSFVVEPNGLHRSGGVTVVRRGDRRMYTAR